LFSRLFGPDTQRRQAEILLDAITAEARRPAFYAELGVPDTLDGRFDMMALVATLVFRAMQQAGAGALAQRTTDHMFMAFDDAIRSLGVGDSGVPRRVKAMGKAYLGRAVAYDTALNTADAPALAEAVLRNIYRGTAPGQASLARLAAWVEGAAQTLTQRSRAQLEAGDFGLKAP
jgi:cytochrome b pre-mRNA-processing protein 3